MIRDSMNAEIYDRILAEFAGVFDRTAVVITHYGSGSSRFIVAELGDRGLEFYVSESGFTVDPALEGDLQGEKDFETIEEAIHFSIEWLNSADE